MVKVTMQSAIKAFYYLLAIDGEIDDSEIEKFKELSKQLDENVDTYMTALIEECNKNIQADNDDYEDILWEGLDEALRASEEKDEEEIPARLIVWNMLVISFADGRYSELEKKLIKHVARILKVEMSVLMEMEQMVQTANAIEKEKVMLENSDRSYRRIRPIVVELEKRLDNIIGSAKELIDDDAEADTPYCAKEESNMIADAVDQVGSFAADAVSNVGNFFGGLFGTKKSSTKKEESEEKK